MEPDADDRVADHLREVLTLPPERAERVVQAALDAPRARRGQSVLLTAAMLLLAPIGYLVGNMDAWRTAEPEAFRIVGDRNGVALLQPDGTPVPAPPPTAEEGSILIVLTEGEDSEQTR